MPPFLSKRVSHGRLGEAEQQLNEWLDAGCQGEMDYMAKHGVKRSRPPELVPGTRSVISVRMDYLPEAKEQSRAVLADSHNAFVSRYALGRDYHKLMRSRLKKLAQRIEQAVGKFGFRVFVDSAPVLEKPIAVQAGLSTSIIMTK